MKLFVRAAVVVLALSGSAAYTQLALHSSNDGVIPSKSSARMPYCPPDGSTDCGYGK